MSNRDPFTERMETIEALHNDGLLTESEYREKRRQCIEEHENGTADYDQLLDYEVAAEFLRLLYDWMNESANHIELWFQGKNILRRL